MEEDFCFEDAKKMVFGRSRDQLPSSKSEGPIYHDVMLLHEAHRARHKKLKEIDNVVFHKWRLSSKRL